MKETTLAAFARNKFARLLFVASFTAFTFFCTSAYGGGNLVLLLNLFLAFAAFGYFEWKYSLLQKSLDALKQKDALAALALSLYLLFEIGSAFYDTKIKGIYHSVSIQYLLVPGVCILALFSVFSLLCVPVKKMGGMIAYAKRAWQTAAKSEKYFFCIASFLAIAGVTILYFSSTAPRYELYADGNIKWNIILGLDTPSHGSRAHWLTLRGSITRPLIGWISLPVTLPAALLSRIFFSIPFGFQLFFQWFNILLLVVTVLMIGRIARFQGPSRVFFFLLFSVSSPFLFWAIPVESYIIPTFYLVLFLYLSYTASASVPLSYISALGSMITSGLVFPLAVKAKTIREYLLKAVGLGLVTVAAFAVTANSAFFLNLYGDVTERLDDFGGKTVTRESVALQYIGSIEGAFAWPDSDVSYQIVDQYHLENPQEPVYSLWQMKQAPVETVRYPGLVLLAAVILGILFNGKDKGYRYIAYWFGVALFMQLILGWNAKEQEMFLCSLYFGWPCIPLAMGLLEKLPAKLSMVRYGLYTAGAVTLAILNIPGLISLIRYCLEYYPAV